MKVLLGLSLILNVVMGFYFFQKKEIINTPLTIERKVFIDRPEIVEKPIQKRKKRNGKSEEIEFDPILATDAESFHQASEELDLAKREFLESIEFSEEMIHIKSKLEDDYQKEMTKIWVKNKNKIPSLADRRVMLENEETHQTKMEALFGLKKWEKYKSFVDKYNNKIFENYKTGDGGGPIMSY